MAKKATHLLLMLRYYHKTLKPYLPLLPKTLAPSPPPPPPPRHFCSSAAPHHLRHCIPLLTEKPTSLISDGDLEDLRSRVSSLAEDILGVSDVQDIAGVLESQSAVDLIRLSPPGFAFVELLSRLKSKPDFALEVFSWRKQADAEIPMHEEEYAKAIKLAGRIKNVNLALDFFHDAVATLGTHTICIYNALLAAYMYNGQTTKAISVFEDIKRDPDCTPTIITYNIVLSIFGRSMLVNHMESVLEIIHMSDHLSPDLITYNTIISGYIRAWMWDKMESTFQRMEAGPVKPNAYTHLLLLRGYANSGNIRKMERAYEVVREIVNNQKIYLIRAMIFAYCRSSDPERVKKVENLMKLLPGDEYRPWINVYLIRLYAQEGLVDSMDKFILEAFNRNTMVATTAIMRSIISGYFVCDAVDRLAGFIRQAENAGWRLCRSLYHAKMVLYGRHNRLNEMHKILDEMGVYKFKLTKKTFLIMHKAYLRTGRRYEAESIVGLMWKHGFGTPGDFFIL